MPPLVPSPTPLASASVPPSIPDSPSDHHGCEVHRHRLAQFLRGWGRLSPLEGLSQRLLWFTGPILHR
jgi:hypothetical protein